MVISTNSKPTIYRNLYENTGRGMLHHTSSKCNVMFKEILQSEGTDMLHDMLSSAGTDILHDMPVLTSHVMTGDASNRSL